MKKTTLGLVAIGALIAAPAMAADLRMPVKAPMAPPPVVTSWTGCYIDGGIGYGLWNQDHNSVLPTTGAVSSITTTDGGRGWLGRVGGGCDYQFSQRIVIGAFADFDFMDLKGTNQIQNLFLPPSFGLAATANERNAWYAGARVGYLVTPSVLAYVEGGYTETRFDYGPFAVAALPTPPGIGPTIPGLASTTFNGWFIGGGTEYALTDILPINGLYWRTEYRFASYSNATVSRIGIGPSEQITPFVQTVTSGLVWRFNFGGPLGARY